MSANPEVQAEQPYSDDAISVAMDTTPDQPPEDTFTDIPEEVMALSTDEILTRMRLLDNDIKVCVQ
jgi:26S proteasome regulatory subunit T5